MSAFSLSHFSIPSFVTVLLVLLYINHSETTPSVDLTTLNKKVVGITLKANKKQYYISTELCPGGIFLTKPVNENCICYNGIFQAVRDCCTPDNTRIQTDFLEWKLNFTCGLNSNSKTNVSGEKPIRAILPLTKPRNPYGSVIAIRSLIGNNTNKWRKFDLEDVIIRNHAEVSLNGKSQFEIVHVKPLGRQIKILAGPSSHITICYSGWASLPYQNLRVRVTNQDPTNDCCINLVKEKVPGEIKADCSSATITVEVLDFDTVPLDSPDAGSCDSTLPPESQRTLKKRNSYFELETIPFKRSPFGPTLTFTRPTSSFSSSESLFLDDSIKGRGPILINRRYKRQAPANSSLLDPVESSPDANLGQDGGGGSDGSYEGLAILPRKIGISHAPFKEQANSINEFVAIMRNDPNAEVREPETFRFKMLKKSFDIFLKVVPNEVVPHVMLKTAFDVFYYLYEELDPIMNEPPEMFSIAMGFLDSCLNLEQPLTFKTFGCPREIDELIIDSFITKKLETYYDNQTEEMQKVIKALQRVEIRKDRRFIPELYDIYVEINWKVTDFVHSFCFEHFGSEFNAHHFYETQLETLFLFPEVQYRWFAKAKNLRYVRGIFSTSNLKLRMKQLDKVVASGHYLSRYNGSYWLYRPNVNPAYLFDRDDSDNPKSKVAHSSGDEERREFSKNLLDEEYVGNELARDQGERVQSSEKHRALIYPYEVPAKLAAGELIWDGIAVCLHAQYSNRRSYFDDSKLWGIQPSLQDLGMMYP